MSDFSHVPNALAKGFVFTITLLMAGLFSLEGWLIAIVSFYVVRFVAGLFLPVTDRGIVGFLLIALWLAVSSGFYTPKGTKKT